VASASQRAASTGTSCSTQPDSLFPGLLGRRSQNATETTTPTTTPTTTARDAALPADKCMLAARLPERPPAAPPAVPPINMKRSLMFIVSVPPATVQNVHVDHGRVNVVCGQAFLSAFTQLHWQHRRHGEFRIRGPLLRPDVAGHAAASLTREVPRGQRSRELPPE
jgi:hypothetical protein